MNGFRKAFLDHRVGLCSNDINREGCLQEKRFQRLQSDDDDDDDDDNDDDDDDYDNMQSHIYFFLHKHL